MIIDVVEAVANEITGGFAFFHGTQDFLNVLIDKKKRPDAQPLPIQFILMDDRWTSDDEIFQNGRIANRYNLLIFFLQQSQLKATWQDRKVGMADMIDAKNEFISKLRRSSNTKALTNLQSVARYNYFDLNMDGVALSCKLELTDVGIDYCFPGPSYLVDENKNFVLDDNQDRILIP